MNKLDSVISEIGVIETALKIIKYSDDPQVQLNCSKYMPFPDKNFHNRIVSIANHIIDLKKEKILITTPEIALIEYLLKSNTISEIIICLPTGLDEETLDRITKNFKYENNVKIIEENTFPKDFNLTNAAIITVGYSEEDKDRAIILRENYKMMNVYKNFYGMRILISCQSGVSNERPIGWIAVNTKEIFTHICTEEGIENA